MAGHFQEFEDEYLETMYEFYESDQHSRVRTGDLAQRLGVSPASATEMIQRLSVKGFIDYVRYKGAQLTEKGLIHGRTMKRRHRLAEVLLERIPFDGNPHETACRLEHAIDDDLEVALTLLLGDPVLDPSGREIPKATTEISDRVSLKINQFTSLSLLETGQEASIVGLLASEDLVGLFGERLAIGSVIKSLGSSQFDANGSIIELESDISDSIIVRSH
ncbi:metal-dependent transcriptional regulator [Candidatus Poseidoniales archaeon]|nr:metal-dependent transcriptional regulator [Candidatus Poseidoniales archaeon]MDA8715830.1 metal-dependent transcriptional regulator [Candidatus Poseidoniales archaeon]|tara:strand:+ start:477 stop:1133 length:657 start_codon:yes stop_codon:yes gene_type:complete